MWCDKLSIPESLEYIFTRLCTARNIDGPVSRCEVLRFLSLTPNMMLDGSGQIVFNHIECNVFLVAIAHGKSNVVDNPAVRFVLDQVGLLTSDA